MFCFVQLDKWHGCGSITVSRQGCVYKLSANLRAELRACVVSNGVFLCGNRDTIPSSVTRCYQTSRVCGRSPRQSNRWYLKQIQRYLTDSWGWEDWRGGAQCRGDGWSIGCILSWCYNKPLRRITVKIKRRACEIRLTSGVEGNRVLTQPCQSGERKYKQVRVQWARIRVHRSREQAQSPRRHPSDQAPPTLFGQHGVTLSAQASRLKEAKSFVIYKKTLRWQLRIFIFLAIV